MVFLTQWLQFYTDALKSLLSCNCAAGACILRRAYLASRKENNSEILEGPTDEALEKREDDAR